MTHTPKPWIWLQVEETSGKADACACRLDAGGPDGDNSGAAFYICPLHEAAPDLLEAFTNYLEAEAIYNKAVTPQATAKAGYAVREKREAALAAIAKAEGG